MSEFKQIIFGKKTFSDILKDIYDNSRKTEKQINELIITLGDKIDGPGAAAIMVPLIVQYLDVKVKNDEHLVKMAAIVQRSISNKQNNNDSLLLTPKEEEELIATAKELQSSANSLKVIPSPSLLLEKVNNG